MPVSGGSDSLWRRHHHLCPNKATFSYDKKTEAEKQSYLVHDNRRNVGKPVEEDREGLLGVKSDADDLVGLVLGGGVRDLL